MVERWICLNIAGSSSVEQFADRLAQQRFAVGGDDRRVLVVGAEIGDVVDQDQARLAAGAGGEPGQRRRRSALARQRGRRRSSNAASASASAGAPSARLQALHGGRQALGADRLEQVIDRAAFEGVDRVLVVGGDEHDLRARADLRRRPRPLRARSGRACGCRGRRRRGCCSASASSALAPSSHSATICSCGHALRELVDQRLRAAALRPRRSTQVRSGVSHDVPASPIDGGGHGDRGGDAGGEIGDHRERGAPP